MAMGREGGDCRWVPRRNSSPIVESTCYVADGSDPKKCPDNTTKGPVCLAWSRGTSWPHGASSVL